MPTIADFRVVEAGSYTFGGVYPNPWSGPEVIEYVFDAPEADAGSRSILLFRLHPEGGNDCRLELYLNGTLIFARTLTPGIERSMHVALPRGLVEISGNNLSMSKVEGDTALTVSELILFFQRAVT